jgi:hypothetical protein
MISPELPYTQHPTAGRSDNAITAGSGVVNIRFNIEPYPDAALQER